jgi:hypothetical protein
VIFKPVHCHVMKNAVFYIGGRLNFKCWIFHAWKMYQRKWIFIINLYWLCIMGWLMRNPARYTSQYHTTKLLTWELKFASSHIVQEFKSTVAIQ